ncbi:MAG: heavy metal translocating P-type ATPase [Oscillospiraceae bacterium]|nr:heavy metal translocating P-type ATPase [Oscillospiraceae bacterium]
MKCVILHESRGRLRIHLCQPRMTIRQADLLDAYLNRLDCVRSAKVYERTGDAVILYGGSRAALLDALARFHYGDGALAARLPENSGRELNRQYQDKLVGMAAFYAARKLFLPAPLQIVYTAVRSLRYLWHGVRCLLRRKLQVEVLDAVSIGVSLVRGDFATAASVMFLLRLGELLEEWTHKKSVGDLARSMSLNVDRVWLAAEGGDVLVPIHDVRPGDRIRVRTGNLIPLDGKVLEGEAMVNQASLTGESVPVAKRAGSLVYAGTVLEEGECVLEAAGQTGCSRYDRIVSMIEDSQKLQSATETRAARLADRLVPYSLLGTVLTYALTRNATRAVSILMVDFSCALKLAMPLSFLSAMGEAGKYHITVKGGKFLEAAAHADTIVFDKTGTLTRACPTVVDVVPFGGNDRDEMLRLAACLEEHYPHSIANAVVRSAKEKGLAHEEMHANVEYLVAHGIASTVNGRRVVIGSHHFVFEDEGCAVPADGQAAFDALPPQYSHLYLAIGGQLAAVICVADPLRPEAAAVLNTLRRLGVSRLVMMTGDSERTAAAIAAQLGVDEYHSEVLPEDKAAFVEAERAAGRTVVMIGDGINDAPALSAADVGIAISDGAAIAREIADITVAADDLFELGTLRQLSLALMDRVSRNYRFVMGFNGSLIVLGALGVLPPATSALLHNLSTLLISVRSMTPLLDGE